MIINLTPHTICIEVEGRRISIPSTGRAEVESTPGVVVTGAHVQGGGVIPVFSPNQMGKVTGLPDEVERGDFIVVSAVAGAAIRKEWESLALMEYDYKRSRYIEVLRACVCPGTGPKDGAIRENGQVVAVTRLVYP